MLLISVPLICFVGWQSTLVKNQYTFRVWEALLTQSRTLGPFYPDQQIETDEVGDLGAYTPSAILRAVSWRTDHEGYRNEIDCSNPQGILLGDSMAVGTGLTDSDTLTSQLSRELQTCVRSYAGGNLGQSSKRIFAGHLNPNYVFLVLSEKSPGSLRELSSGEDRSISGLESIRIKWIHFRKNLYWNYRSAHGVWGAVMRSFMGRKQIDQLIAPDSAAGKKMLFLHEQGGSEGLSETDLIEMISVLNQFSARLALQDTKLIVSFVPNKESIYYREENLPKPFFNDRWKTHAPDFRFQYIDLIGELQNLHEKGGEVFHQLDDTHWNRSGVQVLVKKFISDFHFKKQ